MELADRSKKVLHTIIEEYIQTASPVSSQKIAKKYEMEVSSATIRNAMAYLDDMGFLKQPHVSAGRIPTERAFRLYVDTILETRKLTVKEKENIKKEYQNSRLGALELMKETPRILSLFSHHTGVFLVPKFITANLKQIEFVCLEQKQILVIFISDTGLVQNRIISFEENLSQEELNKFSKYLNEVLTGLTLDEMRKKIVREMKKEKNMYDKLLSRALKLGKEAVSEKNGESEVYVEGKANLLDHPEFSEVEKMSVLLRALEEKKTLVKILDRTLNDEGVQIFIGAENQLREMLGCSLIVASYSLGDSPIGSLGIIGPVRMNYFDIIPLVDYTAKLVSQILESDLY